MIIAGISDRSFFFFAWINRFFDVGVWRTLQSFTCWTESDWNSFLASFISNQGDLFLLVYSVDSRGSFEEVVRLRDQIIETKCHISGGAGSISALTAKKGAAVSNRIPIVIAGNKCDRDMKYVTTECLHNFVFNTDVTSAVTRWNNIPTFEIPTLIQLWGLIPL